MTLSEVLLLTVATLLAVSFYLIHIMSGTILFLLRKVKEIEEEGEE